MDITLAKLTPNPKCENKAWADFDITYKEFSFKIKGCYVIYIEKNNFYVIRLPSLKTHKGESYTLVCFNSLALSRLFFAKSQMAVLDTYPNDQWKKGKYSKFNQGMKRSQASQSKKK